MASLKDYQEKRKFKSTPEPRGKVGRRAQNRFVVQEHHARRLHYDFRLEVDGVLKSWAVPKGPSLDPNDKRLAVQTEDHPLDYAMFEGTIPAGNYGAGQVKIWDRGTFEVEGSSSAREQIARGEIKFILHGNKLKGSFVLVRLRNRNSSKPEWLLIKHKERTVGPSRVIQVPSVSEAGPPEKRPKPALPKGAKKAAMPEKIRLALAATTDKPFSDPEWLFEIKWDGGRVLAEVKDGKSLLWTRSDRNVTNEYPELASLARTVGAKNAWLDGEVVVLDEEGRSDFERLQLRFGVVNPAPQLLEKAPVVYYVFDILYFDGYDLRDVPLIERKALLRGLIPEGPSSPIRYSDHVLGKGRELYEVATTRHLEGIIAKRISSPYPAGRTSSWLKIKLVRDIDAVVGGWTDPRGSREYFGALLVGLYEGENLEYIASVGGGFSTDSQKRLWSQLQNLRINKSPFATEPSTREKKYWVRPQLVAKVKFAEWTDSRHLRAPRFLGLQEDRNPRACTFDEQMSRITKPVESKPLSQSGESGAASKALPQRVHVRSAPEREIITDDRIREELLGGSADNVHIELDGKRLHLTNLNKVYFPDDGYTKRDLLAYYFHIAEFILPFLKDRPLVLRRYPNGIAATPFFQKDAAKETPDWVKTVEIRSEDRGRSIRYIIANDRPTLLYLTNLGCIDHNPWSSRYDSQDYPDYVFFDLDPTDAAEFSTVISVAKEILTILAKRHLTAFAKTSGATGFHIYLPIEPRYTYEQARMFVQVIASMVSKKHRAAITSERTVSKRPVGSIYVDAHQNSRGQSLASVYSARAFPHAPVSAPVRTGELTEKLRPEKLNIKTMITRIQKSGDLWSQFWSTRQRLESLLEA